MTSSSSDVYTQFPSTHHSFDIELATELGSSDQAILMAHISFWIKFNIRKGRNFHDGQHWMYQTQEDILKHFPYWTLKHLRTQIDKLVEKGYLIKGNYNKHPMDKTTWYAIKIKEKITTAENGDREPKTATLSPKTAEQYQILNKDTKEQQQQEEVVVVDKQVKKMKTFLERFSTVHGPEWDMPISILQKNIFTYGIDYVSDHVNYMTQQQTQALKDEGNSYKNKKTPKIEKPMKYLGIACKENWADSQNKRI